MVVMLLPISDATYKLLAIYYNLICVIFLIDFFLNLRGASKKSDYFIGQCRPARPDRLDPIVRGIQIRRSLRLARLSRLARITRLIRGENKKTLGEDILENRSRYAMFMTILLTILVLTVASVLVLQFESNSPDANITSGGKTHLVFNANHHH